MSKRKHLGRRSGLRRPRPANGGARPGRSDPGHHFRGAAESPTDEPRGGGGDPTEEARPGKRLRPPRARGSRRDGSGSYWLCGQHAVRAALANPARAVARLLGTAEGLAGLGPTPPGRPPPETVERARLDAILPPGSVHQGLAILVSPLAPRGLDDVLYALAAGPATAVVLDHVTDPRNVGAALRAAAAFGADFVIVTERHAPDESAALAKAASGALDSVPLVRVVNLARALETLKEEAFVCVGLDGDADLPISAVDLVGRVALVLGAEGSGLRRLTRERCDRLVRIPQGKAVESLNVASAAAIALYERARQRDR